MKYRGRMIVEVEGASSANLDALVPVLQGGLDRARREFPQVEAATAARDPLHPWVTIEVLLESEIKMDESRVVELDDVADSLMRRALECMADDSDEIVVLESALIPA